MIFVRLHGNLPLPRWNLAKPGEQQDCPVRPAQRPLRQDTTLYMLSRYRGHSAILLLSLTLSSRLFFFYTRSQGWVDSVQPMVPWSLQTTMISLQRHIDKYITSGTWSLDFYYILTDWEVSLERMPHVLGGAGSFLLGGQRGANLPLRWEGETCGKCDCPPSLFSMLLPVFTIAGGKTFSHFSHKSTIQSIESIQTLSCFCFVFYLHHYWHSCPYRSSCAVITSFPSPELLSPPPHLHLIPLISHSPEESNI